MDIVKSYYLDHNRLGFGDRQMSIVDNQKTKMYNYIKFSLFKFITVKAY